MINKYAFFNFSTRNFRKNYIQMLKATLSLFRVFAKYLKIPNFIRSGLLEMFCFPGEKSVLCGNHAAPDSTILKVILTFQSIFFILRINIITK